VWLVAGLAALVAAGAYAAVRASHPDDAEAGRPAGTAQTPVGSPSPSPSPSAWPSGAGACGLTAFRPLMSPQPLTERTGVRVLVGGYGVRLVDADTGTARPVSGLPTDSRHMSGQLVAAAGGVYVLAARCDGTAGRVYRLANGTAHPVAGGPTGDLLAGPTRVWTVTYPDASTGSVVLRLVGSGRSLALPPDTFPVADTGAGLVVAGDQGDRQGRPPDVTILDPATGRPVRILGAGLPLAADSAQVLLLLGPCFEGEVLPFCTVARIDIRTGQVRDRYPLPNGRVPVSAGFVSRDGRLVAFQLARVHPDPRFDPDHPIPPSDVAVLHLDTGRLDVVPGLELAPKTAAGLVFAPDGRWLFATVSDGDHVHVLAWHPGLDGPRAVARLAGPVAWAPPLLIA
jgi:hypothetical protein